MKFSYKLFLIIHILCFLIARINGISKNALSKHCLKCKKINNKHKIKLYKKYHVNKRLIKHCSKCKELNKKYEVQYSDKKLNKSNVLSQEENYNKQNVVTATNNEQIASHIKNNSLNLNKIQEKLIVSLTSYPERIKYIKIVLESLVNQSVPFSMYHIVIVLAIPEFPNKENDLPASLVDFINKYSDLIEILWYERNINNHKRLIPTLKKYPNNPILICDDYIIRKQWWIKMFLEDHKIYPNDIIFGA